MSARRSRRRDAAIDGGAEECAGRQRSRHARHYLGDKLIRTARPQSPARPRPWAADRRPAQYPLTRKIAGRGFHTDPAARVLRPDGTIFPGLFAVGEAAGFGGGGIPWLPSRSRAPSSAAASSRARWRARAPDPGQLASARPALAAGEKNDLRRLGRSLICALKTPTHGASVTGGKSGETPGITIAVT